MLHDHALPQQIAQSPVFTRHLVRLRDKIHSKELGKGMSINGIGLHFCVCDGFQVFCMGKHDTDTERTQKVAEPIPIGGAFDNSTPGLHVSTHIE